MTHKYRIGQLVRYSPPFGAPVAKGDFTIVRLLPETDYRIKAKNELNERVAHERELKPLKESDE
jgi:hypothetical protein